MPPNDLSIPGFYVARCFDEVGSTMDEARALVEQIGGIPGAAGLIMTRRQSAGRGRQGRSWSGADGSFMGTFLFHTSLPAANLSGYSLAVGVGIARALAAVGASVTLKWPNDIVVVQEGRLRKLGGILTEVQESNGTRVLLVGIGLNLTARPSDVPDATCVKEVSQVTLEAQDAARALAAHLLTVQRDFEQRGGFAAVRPEWESLSCFRSGLTVLTVEVGSRTSRGVYAGVEDSGALLISRGGTTEAFHSGHILSVEGARE